MKNKAKNPADITETAGAILVLILTFFFSLKCALTAMTGVFSFDGGMNIQTAHNLAEHLRFATDYFIGENGFCHAITTGLPVMAPIAVLFKISGESFTAGLFVNALYMVLLFISIAYYVKRCLKLGSFYTLLALLLFFGTKDLFEFGFGIYGEIPMCFYIMMSFIFIYKYDENEDKNNTFLSGIFLGLGYITKTVTLILIPAMIFCFAWDHFMVYGNKIKGKSKTSPKYLIGFIAGFLIPAVLNEIYKLSMLGIGGFISWWSRQSGAINMQAGAVKAKGIAETYGLILKYNRHIDLLAAQTGINRPVLTVLLYLLIFAFLGVLYYSYKYLKNKKPQYGETVVYDKSALMIMCMTVTYFVWWLLITPTGRAWYRRIITGVIFYDICFVFIVYISGLLLKKYTPAGGKKAVSVLTCIVFTALFLYWYGG